MNRTIKILLSLFIFGALFTSVSFLGNEALLAQQKTSSTETISALLSKTLTIEINPPNGGTVTRTPNKDVYDDGEQVALKANAASGYSFFYWSGDIDRYMTNPRNLYMEENRTIIANFVMQNSNKITTPNTPSGPTTASTGQFITFTASGAQSNIGGTVQYIFDWGNSIVSEWGSGTRQIAYSSSGTYNVRVRARSTSDPYTVSAWSNTVSVRVTGADKHILTIIINPDGAGRVTVDPDKQGYDDGDYLTLRAIANAGYSFTEWTGGLKSTKNPTNIYMFKDRTITANFSGGGGEETVSIPTKPSGQNAGNVGDNLSFTTGGSASSLGHNVEYQFDWGDASQSAWGNPTGNHSYTTAGTVNVKARARCQSHIQIVSGWSQNLSVTISETQTETVSTPTKPTSPSTGSLGQNMTFNTGGSTSSLGHNVEYQFDWGDGSQSVWGNPTGNHSYTTAGTVNVKARARCQSHTQIVSGWSQNLSVTISETPTETVSAPTKPTGSNAGIFGQNMTFNTSGSTSSLGHNVEYQFDWGDGSQSTWSNPPASHSFAAAGNYHIKARARCKTHTNIVSGWSQSLAITITISNTTYTLVVNTNPADAGFVNPNPQKNNYYENESIELFAVPNNGNGVLAGNIYREAETVQLTGSFAIAFDNAASNNFYIYGARGVPKDGSATYAFELAAAGNYYIWGRCFALTSVEDSYFINMDQTADTLTWHLDTNYGIWKWQKITNNHQQYVFNLSAGQHDLTVIKRDLNARLDKLIITNDPQFVPQGKAELPQVEVSYVFDYWGGNLTGSDNPAQLIMDSDKDVVAYFHIEGEQVSAPNTPQGPITGYVDTLLSFFTGGSVNNLGHPVEYQFDWGDGTQSAWGDSTADYDYTDAGTYSIKARARCVTHLAVVSEWSENLEVFITSNAVIYNLTVNVNPLETGFVNLRPNKPAYEEDETVQLFAFPAGINGVLNNNIYIEAETGHFVGNFDIGSDTSAANNFYMFGSQGIPKDGSVQYNFEIQTAGDYYVWGRCFALKNDEDSYFILMDGGSDTLTWHLRSDYNVWKWQKITQNNIVNAFVLAPGQHALTVIERDLNVRLDKLIITNDPNFQPTGKAELPIAGDRYFFDHWSGNLTGSNNPVSMVMNGNKSVTANFRMEGSEIVTPPTTISGPDSGFVGHSLTFTTGGSTNNLGNEIAYQFDWGDDSKSSWDSSSNDHIFQVADTFFVKSRARSKSDTLVISGWSTLHRVIITDEPTTVFSLNITVIPTGKGSVTKTPNATVYAAGDTVNLQATPIAGNRFDHWSGDITGTTNPITIIMNSNKQISAHFVEVVEFVTTPAVPNGPDSSQIGYTVTFSTGGSTCNMGHPVEYQFDWGDSTLSDWGSQARQHIYTSSDTMSVKARARCKVNTTLVSEWSDYHSIIIARSFKYTLTIAVDPFNSGSVNKTPFKDLYENGETVILSPLAVAGYAFDHWSGHLTGTNNPAFIVMNGNKTVTAHFKVLTDVVSHEKMIPEKFTLGQNYPNPFNPNTTIKYQIPAPTHVTIKIFNVQGQLIKDIVNGLHQPGYYHVQWNADDFAGRKVPSGVYIYKICAEEFNQIKKMILLK